MQKAIKTKHFSYIFTTILNNVVYFIDDDNYKNNRKSFSLVPINEKKDFFLICRKIQYSIITNKNGKIVVKTNC